MISAQQLVQSAENTVFLRVLEISTSISAAFSTSFAETDLLYCAH